MRKTSPVFAYDRQVIPGTDGRPPLPSGRPLKFLVEDPVTKNRSSTWRIWTGKKRDDVYLCETESGGGFKTSLHSDGCTVRVAMTKEMADSHGSNRAVLKEQPITEPVGGWSEGPRILVPCADLRPLSQTVPEDVIRIPTSTTSSAILVLVLLEEPKGSTVMQVEGTFLLGVLIRPNSGLVWVCAQPTTLSAAEHQTLAALRADARPSAPPEKPDLRFVGILSDDKHLVLVDLTVN
jgi:hypothetical protein